VHYTPNEGLVQTQIMSCFQDSKGFIWLGTKGGISRFDGLQFKNFTINEGLSSNFIFNIIENHCGNLIAITNNGFSYIVGGKIINFYCNIKGFSYNRIVKVRETKNNEWEIIYFSDSSFRYIYFKNGVFREDKVKNKSTENYKFNDLYKFDFSRIHNQDDYFIFSVDNILYKLKNAVFTKEFVANSEIKYITKGYDDNLYVLLNDTLFKYYDRKMLYFNKLSLIDKERIISITIDHKAKHYYIDKDNHLHLGNYIDFYNQSFLNKCFIDKDNVFWLWGEEGLYKLQSQLFTNFISEKSKINNNIWCISEDKNNYIYFGSYEGSLVKYKNNKFETVNLKQKLNPYPDNLHFYMGSTTDKEKNIYFSMTKLYRFDGNNFEKLKIENEDKFYSSLFTYIDTVEDKFMAGTTMGLVIAEKNKAGKIYKIYPGNKKGRNIACITKDKYGRYWLGGFKNISILDKKRIIHLPNKEMNFNYGGNTMHVDYKGNIWIGNENGLFVYDYKKFRKVENPYFNSITGFITEIDKKHLLIGNMNQLGVFYLENYYITEKPYIKLFDKYNGFLGSECGQNGAFKDSQGYIWIPAADRVVRFEPKSKMLNRILPKVYIQEISVLDNKMHKNTISNDINPTTKIILTYKQKDIRIDYLAITTTAPEKVRYKYFLEGYDNDWSESTSLRFAVYTNLQPGNYNFYLKACNEDNSWMDIPQLVTIQIQKAFWQTIWFMLLIFITIVGSTMLLTYLFLINKKKKQIEKIETEKKITELQLNTIRGQIDPHFTFNVINSIASVIYKEDKESAMKMFNKFSNLLRVVITSSAKTYRSIDDEISFVKNYLEIEKFRFKDKFEYSITLDKNVDKYKNIPKMVIQTHVENAIKHGLMHKEKEGKLSVSIKCNDNENIIIIEDNGIGRKKAKHLSKQSTGIGLKIINSYYDLFNKYNKEKIIQEIIDLEDVSDNSSGTKIIIKIPLNFNFKI
jgi:ligand-binding sensor domain-containing protein